MAEQTPDSIITTQRNGQTIVAELFFNHSSTETFRDKLLKLVLADSCLLYTSAANRIIIPVQAEYLPAKGLEQLLSTVSKVKRQINPKLQIDGILLMMVDNRTNFAKEIAALLRDTYGSKIKVFGTEIPHSVRAKEISAEGKSIFAHDPGGKVAEGYRKLTKEVLKLEKQREKSRTGIGR